MTLNNIKAVIQAFFRKKKRQIGGLDEHIWEQIVWRRTRVKDISPECWNKGYCKICGCEIIGKTMEDRGCENEKLPCYPEMMNQASWNTYKELMHIKLFE